MQYNNIIAVILSILFISGCVGWKAYTKSKCIAISKRQCQIYADESRYVKYMQGYFKNKPHAWCEVWCEKHNQWEIHDDAIWYVEYHHFSREKYVTNGVQDYTFKKNIK